MIDELVVIYQDTSWRGSAKCVDMLDQFPSAVRETKSNADTVIFTFWKKMLPTCEMKNGSPTIIPNHNGNVLIMQTDGTYRTAEGMLPPKIIPVGGIND